MTNDTQKQIIRQSQLKLILDYTNSCDKCIPLKDLVGITELMVDYVSNGYSKDLGERLNKVDQHIKTL